MAASTGSIFSEQNCSSPYFVVTGMTMDNIVSDELTISDTKLQLHRHLIAQGFDAVIFYDPVHMLHFYDAKSSYVMRTYTVPTERQLRQALARRTQDSAAAPPPQQRSVFLRHRPHRQAEQTDVNAGPVWEMNMGQIYATQAYERLADLLEKTQLRCAVVFTDTQALQLEGNDIIQARHKAFRALLSNRAENKNIVIFMAEAGPRVPLSDILSPDSQACDWANFVDSYIFPVISAEDSTHLLRIPPPNAAEIGNALSMLRLQQGLRPDLMQLDGILTHLAAYCSENWVSMATLYNLIRKWQIDNPDGIFDLNAASRITGRKEYLTAQQQLDRLIGMTELKEHFSRLRQQAELTGVEPTDPSSSRFLVRHFTSGIHGHGLNTALVGNPGTGKSTVAELIGGLYRELGLLPTGKVISVSATELTAADVMHDRVHRAIGGILLIDKAYALMNNYSGQDVIDALVADMGSYAGQFAVILAGHREPTLRLLAANDGLHRRVPQLIELPDYSGAELLQIFLLMAEHDSTVDLSELRVPEQMTILQNIFNGWVGEAGPEWGNAGEVQNLLNRMKENCSARVSLGNRSLTAAGDRKLHLTLRDIPEDMQTFASSSRQNLETAYQELDKIQGLDNVKRAVYNIARSIQLSGGSKQEPGFYVFQGPPGTGKTMMAEKMGYLFQKLEIIKRRIPYIITARELLEPPPGTKPGETPDPRKNSLQAALTASENGILFIDEAHQLADSEAGRQLIRELVPLMEAAEFRRKHCIILAGYTIEMDRLFDCDSGLSSRFPLRNRIKFKNYTAAELREILKGMAEQDGELPSEAFLQRSELALSKYLASPRTNFGNARFMRNEYLTAAKEMRDARIVREQLQITSVREVLSPEQLEQLNETDLHTLTGLDLPTSPVNFAALAGPPDVTPEAPLTAEVMTERLFDKPEVQAFIGSVIAAASERTPYAGGKNYTICGPLGSGRETIVRTIANVFAELELIDSREVFFFNRGDLEAGYVGQTAGKTRRAVTEAQGCTVVLLNPSSMLPNNETDNSFGPEAISTFLSLIPVFGENTSFVLIDSEAGMDLFMKAYPACRGSFEKHFALEDLSIESMQQIFRLEAKDFLFDAPIAGLMDDFIANWTADRGGLGSNFQSWANGDEISRLLQKLRDQWEIRSGESRTNDRGLACPVITREMFPVKLLKYLRSTREGKENVLASLDEEIGLRQVRQAIRAIEVRMRRTDPGRVSPGHYCFLGNPGVGKTRMAQKLGNILQATNVLKQGLVITRTAREMMEQRNDFDKIVRMARDNLLFIDEAHQLADTPAGIDVIKRLLTVLEDTEITKNTCFVLAGYPREMRNLLAVDAGLRSRFDASDNIILFEDYTVDELIQILCSFGRNAPDIPQLSTDHSYDLRLPENEAFLEEVRRGLEDIVAKKDPNYGNARYVRNLLHDAIAAQLLRLDALHPGNEPISDAEWAVLLPEDLPPRYRGRPRDRQDEVSLSRIPASAVSDQPAAPILPETLDRSLSALQQSILLLEISDENGKVISHGTGFLITEDGYALTCCHVVRRAARIRARLYYPGIIGGERWFDDCTVLQPILEDIDMALIRINRASGFVPLHLRAPGVPISPTEEILICGYPFGVQLQLQQDLNFTPSVFTGSVSSIQAIGTEHERVFIDCSAKSGNSGSPVVSRADGTVIGMLDASTTHQSGKLVEEINYFTPIRMAWNRFIRS